MKTTSHFIGVSLKSSQLADLFVAIDAYSRENKLTESILLQNVNSTHITFHYLPADVPKQEEGSILEEVRRSQNGMPSFVGGLTVDYFGGDATEKVCFIRCKEDSWMEETHMLLARNYPHEEVPENSLTFVPHITLFRIQDISKYAPHKDSIDSMVSDHIKNIGEKIDTKGLRLYRVNSGYQPEIQITV